MEVALLDHQSQQYKLLTLVACVYALLSTEDFMDKLYFKGVDQISKGNFELLPEVSFRLNCRSHIHINTNRYMLLAVG